MHEERSFTAAAPEVRFGGSGHATIIGYAAVFNSPSEELPVNRDQPNGRKFREVIRPGAFTITLASLRNIFANFQHDQTAILGSTGAGTLRLSEDSRGLRYEIDPPNTSAGRDVVELIRRGDVRMSSFGFKIRGKDGHSFRREGDGYIRELRSVELLDVSPVTAGAYKATSVSLRSLEGFEALLESDGHSTRMAMRLALAERT
jgi:uncharacterized protein